MRQIFYGLAGLLLASTAQAASIKYSTIGEIGVIAVSGEIAEGDAATFQSVAERMPSRTIVVLDSEGGRVGDGLAIGATIRLKKFATAVAPKMTCVSVCGLIWLAGVPRSLSDTSMIGFHAAYREDGSESGVGNAMVGAFLNQLGLPLPAIVFITSSPPEKISWLHPKDATRVGITYNLVEDDEQESASFGKPEPRPAIAPAPVPARPTAEQQAVQLVLGYHAAWSQGGSNVESLAPYYAASVNFYGGVVPREKIMDGKRKFSARWPVRQYTINPNSIFAQCDPDGTCTVTGIVAWDCTSPERGEHSVGTANFALRLANGVIVSENGSVLTGHKDTVEPQQATTTPAYAQGRQARLTYEEWLSKLPDGEYKDGVLFWAKHRSDKPAPSCSIGSVMLGAGCIAARNYLTSVDQRRTSEKDYWLGWNSL